MSRMIASGWTLSASSRPASADSAATTAKPSSSSIRENVSATEWSASTMRIVRVGEGGGQGSPDAITPSLSGQETGGVKAGAGRAAISGIQTREKPATIAGSQPVIQD